MAKIVVPNTGAGFISPNEDLVGFQTTQGGGLTNTNFIWNYGVVEKIDKENLSEGDLVFFNTRGGVSHVGVYLRNGYFVHSSSKDGVRISSLNEKYYHRKFIGAGRINMLESSL